MSGAVSQSPRDRLLAQRRLIAICLQLRIDSYTDRIERLTFWQRLVATYWMALYDRFLKLPIEAALDVVGAAAQ